MCDELFSIPNWCDSCETWHRAHYWLTEDQESPYSVCDDDGNHDAVDAEDVPSFEEQDKAWRDYSQWVACHGEDPLSEFMVRHSRKVKQRWQFRFSNSILGPLLASAEHAGRRYDVTELPRHVQCYLNLGTEAHGLKLGDFATWDELVAAQPGIKPGKWWAINIEHDEPRDAALVARELKRLARRHLRQNPIKEAA